MTLVDLSDDTGGAAAGRARAPATLARVPGEFALRYFGQYAVLGEISRGSMGVVYLARQMGLNRKVALKVIHPERLATPAARQQFRTKAEALAHLDHPHIVPIYEVGEHDDQPFLAMKWVEGGTLAEALQRQNAKGKRQNESAGLRDVAGAGAGGPSPRNVIQRALPGHGEGVDEREASPFCIFPFSFCIPLVATLARAVHFAHERRVLHRDLKPSNILLDEHGAPYVADFGVAQFLARASAGQDRALRVGTAPYMAPEQAAGPPERLTPAADIYSLGVILHELLTGQTPPPALPGAGNPPSGTGRTLAALPDADRASGPRLQASAVAALRALNPRVDLDLAAVCWKCLEPDPARRYGSAAALADDLERWLRHHPVQARPASRLHRVRKWARRNPVVAGLSALLLVALAGSLGLSVWQLRRAERFMAAWHFATKRQVESHAVRAQREAESHLASDHVHEGLRDLAELVRKSPSHLPARTRLWAGLTERLLPWPFTPDSRFVLTAALDGSLHVWDRTSGVQRVRLPHDTARGRFALSADGARVATLAANGAAHVWQMPDGKFLFEVGGVFSKRAEDGILAVEFSPDGTQLATAGADGRASSWRTRDGQLIATLEHGEPLRAVRFHPDNGHLLTAGSTTCRLWALPPTPKEPPQPNVPPSSNLTPHASRFTLRLAGPVRCLEFSPAGDRFLTAAADAVEVWDARTGSNLWRSRFNGPVQFATFSRDGRWVASANAAERTHVQHAASGAAYGSSMSHRQVVHTVRFDHTAKRLVTTCDNGRAQVWWMDKLRPALAPCRHTLPVWDAVFSPATGRRLLTVSADRTARQWALDRVLATEVTLPSPVPATLYEWSPEGECLAVAGRDHAVRLFSQGGQALREAIAHTQPVTSLSFSPDARWLASADPGGRVYLSQVHRNTTSLLDDTSYWPMPVGDSRAAASGSPAPPAASPARRLLWSLDSQTLAIVTASHVSLWHEPDGWTQPRVVLPVPRVTTLDFAPDGTQLALADDGPLVQVFDTRTGRPSFSALAHPDTVMHLRFSTDGRWLASGGQGNAARVWDARTGAPVTPFVRPGSDVTWVAFSPDSRLLLTGARSGQLGLWDARTGQAQSNLPRHRKAVLSAEFSPDGQWVASSGADHFVRLAHVASALAGSDPQSVPTRPVVRFSRDGRHLLITAQDSPARLVNVPAAFLPEPEGLLALTELVLGQRLNELGGWEDLTTEEWLTRQRLITARWSRLGPPPQTQVFR